MPTIAMMAKEDPTVYAKDAHGAILQKFNNPVEKFIELLDKKINEAKDQLIERFDWICEQNPASAKFMYENGTIAGYVPEEGIRSALKHGTLAVG